MINNVIVVVYTVSNITMTVDKFSKENTKNQFDNHIECGGRPATYLLVKW